MSTMKRTFLIFLLSGIACGQFLRFDDSFEDDSREGFFRRGGRTNQVNGFRGGANVGAGGGRRAFFDDSDSDSDEHFFRNNRNNRNRNNRNRFDDSDEIFFGTNRNSFVRTNTNNVNRNFNRNTNLRTTGTTLNRNNNHNARPFNKNSNGQSFNRNFLQNNNNNNFNRFKIDSVEDLFEDLFDDDLDDRIKARNTLARLGHTGNNFFRNNGQQPRKTGFGSFNTRVGQNRFNRPTPRANPNTFRPQFNNNKNNNNNNNRNRNGLNHFSIQQHQPNKVNRFNNGFAFKTTVGNTNTNTNRFNSNKNQFRSQANRGVPLSSTNTRRPAVITPAKRIPFATGGSSTNNRFSGAKRTSSFSSPNALQGNTFRNTKRSPLPSRPGFNWPGGNGYYVSMSTGNSKPVSYFVKYDD